MIPLKQLQSSGKSIIFYIYESKELLYLPADYINQD